jgi:hypothetical protein
LSTGCAFSVEAVYIDTVLTMVEETFRKERRLWFGGSIIDWPNKDMERD